MSRENFSWPGTTAGRREGSRDYRGSIIWHEGEILFKKDLILAAPCRCRCW